MLIDRWIVARCQYQLELKQCMHSVIVLEKHGPLAGHCLQKLCGYRAKITEMITLYIVVNKERPGFHCPLYSASQSTRKCRREQNWRERCSEYSWGWSWQREYRGRGDLQVWNAFISISQKVYTPSPKLERLATSTSSPSIRQTCQTNGGSLTIRERG